MRLFTIESESPYYIKLEQIRDIEEAGDDFVTEDELRDMLGLGEGGYISTYGVMLKRAKIEEKLNELKAQMKEKGKKSIIIEDEEFVEFFRTNSNHSVSDFVKGLRRVGNRLSLFEKTERKTVSKKDFQTLISIGVRCINGKVKFTFDIKYSYEDYVGAVNMIKKLVTIEEIESYVNSSPYVVEWKGQLKWFKMIWDNPNMLDQTS